MRKVLLPIMSLVCLILSCIVFGIAAQTAVRTVLGEYPLGNFYQLVWERGSNVLAQLAFWFFLASVVLMIFNAIPTKIRKWTLLANATLFIAAGVLMLVCPKKLVSALEVEATGNLIAIGVLTICAGAVTGVMTALEVTKK